MATTDGTSLARSGFSKSPEPATTVRQEAPRALVLDVENILIDARTWEIWLLRLLREQLLDPGDATFFRDWHNRWCIRSCRGEEPLRCGWHRYLRERKLSACQAEELLHSALPQYEQFLESCRPLSGTLETLAAVAKSGLRIAVLADAPWSQERLKKILDRLQLPIKCAGAWTTSSLGTAAPEAQAFRQLAGELDLSVEEIAYLGWGARQFHAARTAGVYTIGYNSQVFFGANTWISDIRELPRAMRMCDPNLLSQAA